MNLSILSVMALALFFRLWRVGELMVFSGETNNLFYYLTSYLAGEKPGLLGLEAAQYVHHLFHLPWYLWTMIPVYFAGGGISRRRSPMWRVAPLGNLWIQKQRRMGAHAATLRCIVNTPSALSMTTGCNSCFANLA